jgi:hypothetical protein
MSSPDFAVLDGSGFESQVDEARAGPSRTGQAIKILKEN